MKFTFHPLPLLPSLPFFPLFLPSLISVPLNLMSQANFSTPFWPIHAHMQAPQINTFGFDHRQITESAEWVSREQTRGKKLACLKVPFLADIVKWQSEGFSFALAVGDSCIRKPLNRYSLRSRNPKDNPTLCPPLSSSFYSLPCFHLTVLVSVPPVSSIRVSHWTLFVKLHYSRVQKKVTLF